ncbi:trafficking protein particle complex subunit 8-like [Phthorimaea operculella]|nr:trafficking protein particle complex subunit 8-like [Phthorimaea operculella]
MLRPRVHAPALCLLAYYETGAPRRPHRLLRHVFRFNVTEAVELSATPRRSVRTVDGTAVENMNIAVEIKNVYSEKDEQVALEILDTYLISRQWKLTDLMAARNKDDPLMSHERLHLVFKARRILEALPEGRVEATRLKVTNNPDTTDNSTIPSYTKFVVEYKPSFLDITDTTVQEKKTAGLIQSMLVVRWKFSNKTRNRSTIGQHCLWLDGFTKAESRERIHTPIETPALALDELDSKTDISDGKKRNKDNVVVFRLEHSNQIKHNFNQMKLCLVPITINIVNCYGVPVQVFIDMSKQQNKESYGVLGWAGALSQGASIDSEAGLGVSVALGGFESRAVSVRAVCAAPGTYLVGSAFALSTQHDKTPAAVHCANDTSLLVVHQA